MNIAFMDHEQALQINREQYSEATSYREDALSRAATDVDRNSHHLPTQQHQHDSTNHRSTSYSSYLGDDSDRWSVHTGGSSISPPIASTSNEVPHNAFSAWSGSTRPVAKPPLNAVARHAATADATDDASYNLPHGAFSAWSGSTRSVAKPPLSAVTHHATTAEATDDASSDNLDDWELAIQLQVAEEHEFTAAAQTAQAVQAAFDAEDAQIRAERAKLDQARQKTFECAICMETCIEDNACRVDECQHALCRSCMRSYIVSELGEKRYPIICPLCKTAASSRSRRDPTGDCGQH